jgi:hypothetical protein
MFLSPDTVTLHLFRAFEIVAVPRFLKPSQLADALTRPLTIRIGTKALPFAHPGIRGIQLTTMQTVTTFPFFHNPQNQREEKTRSKENPPAKQRGSKKTKKSFKRKFLKKNQEPPLRHFQTGQITPLSFRR